jgi:F0F1-type ATP synthase assembly protein I
MNRHPILPAVLALTTLLGVLAGRWLDEQLGTLPIFVVVGLFAGMGIGALGMYRIITRFLARFD